MDSFRLSPKIQRGFGVTRYSQARGLRHLRTAGLVEVVPRKGCAPEVKLIGVEP